MAPTLKRCEGGQSFLREGIGNRVLNPAFQASTTGVVCCRERLGGLIKRYYRAAA